jgi:hypothetical protein
MVSFQNYLNHKCCLITKSDSDGLSLFFKIYKNIYRESFDIIFTTENVNEFIRYMLKVSDILQKIKQTLFTDNLVKNKNNIFDAANKKLNSLKKNNMYIIITSIIGYLKNNTNEEEIIKSIEKCILYHFFSGDLDDKEKRKEYQLKDRILFQAGGAYIDNHAKDVLKDPTLISSKITVELMRELLNKLIKENIKNKNYEVRTNGKNKVDKRRPRKLFEKILISNYYYCKIPTQFLQNNFWVEHIFPFSSSWNDIIDIHRLGNIIPIIDSLNKDRNNHHIREYKKFDNLHFIDYIDIIPNIEMYDSIISHDDRKPHIFNSDQYNMKCSDNEEKLINCFLDRIK